MNISIHLKAIGITQQELGSKLGNFSRQYISDLEHGRKNISLQVARKLAVIFDKKVDRYRASRKTTTLTSRICEKPLFYTGLQSVRRMECGFFDMPYI